MVFYPLGLFQNYGRFDMKMLAENLLSLRQGRQLSQSYLAKVLGISPRTYQRYETGERLPDLETAIKLADFYRLSLDKLIGRG